ncbi:LysR family transcriptional regulator [Saccharopolyspora griseoalba]|uniref:LysR family transcriptional regulator n=1 Tax=Saccharopolyspora griseoalba TaxID=1431848 RepID=A0ABW2LH74_9PSEU
MDVRALRNLDLNLLPSLDALLEERNVSRAADRVGVSQPSMSAALGKLRRHFGDELLQRSGNRYHLTALAAQLAGRTKAALAGVERVFDAAPDFDPAASRREFTLFTSDYAALVLGRQLSELVAERAPHARLHFEQNVPQVVEHIDEALRTVDGIMMPHGFLDELPAQDLYTDEWVCVVSEDNERIGEPPTLDDLAELPWVATYRGPHAYTPAIRQLKMLGIEPHVQVAVESFLAVPFLISGTPRVALLQKTLARRLGPSADVRALPCPWDVLPLPEAFWWHPLHDADPAHLWLREVLREAGRQVTARYGLPTG